LPKGNGPAIQFNNFTGNATILSNTLSNVVSVQGSGSGNVWLAGNTTDYVMPEPYISTSYLVNQSAGTTGVFTQNRYQDPGPNGTGGQGSLPDPDQNASLVTPAFVQKMLAQDRASRFSTITDLPAGVTDAKLYRIVAINALYGVHITK
jgi:hypothetical protein